MTPQEYAARQGRIGVAYDSRKPESKYKNVKTDGHDSGKESRRANALKMLERAGAIRNLKEQVRFLLIPKQEEERPAYYTADFTYEQNVDGQWIKVVEDSKTEITKTEAYVLRRKLMRLVHQVKILET